MKIVVDSKIPYIRGFAEKLGETFYVDGTDISANTVQDADALIIRTRTHCDRQLLENSKVKFIATATIGYDHLDTDWLAKAGIKWTNCPGCNASSVGQYVRNVLLLLAGHGCWQNGVALTAPQVPPPPLDRSVFGKLTLGIVGVGHVGQCVWKMAQELGFGRIMLCDPPLAESGKCNYSFHTLREVAENSDVVTFHTPLTHREDSVPYPTFHLADEKFFHYLRPHAVLINTCRGEVVKTEALKQALSDGTLHAAIIDTWENEPDIDHQLLHEAYIATPHIAGYSADGKASGTRMALQAVARFFGREESAFQQVCAPTLPRDFIYFPEGNGWRMSSELKLYDPTRDSLALKQSPDQFEYLRGHYPLRREQ